MTDKQPIHLRPTLMIGLGGTGAKVILQVKARLEENLGRKSGYHKAIKFLSFDTANENLTISQPNHPDIPVTFSTEQEFVRISDVPLQDLMQSRDTNPAIAAILPDVLTSTQIDQGAQQIRRLGRVALFYHYGRVREKLNQVITQLRDVDVMGKLGETEDHTLEVRDRSRIHVFIACSISGGTGAGTFLDMAYLTRHIARAAGISDTSAVDVVGVLLLPDVFTEIRTTGAEKIRANAYASLLDLEYFNQPTRAGQALYHVEFPGEIVEVAGPPFSLCYLVGRSSPEATFNGLTDLAPVLGEALQAVIASRIGEQVDATLDNIRSTLNSYYRGYRAFYSAIGTAQIIYPRAWVERQFVQYLKRSLINQRLLNDRENQPSETNEAADFLREIKGAITDSLGKDLPEQAQITRTLMNLGQSLNTRDDLINDLQRAFRESLSQHEQLVVPNAERNRQTALRRIILALQERTAGYVDQDLLANRRGLLWTINWLETLHQNIERDLAAPTRFDPMPLYYNEVGRISEQIGIPVVGLSLARVTARGAITRLQQLINVQLRGAFIDTMQANILRDYLNYVDDQIQRLRRLQARWEATAQRQILDERPNLSKTTQYVLDLEELGDFVEAFANERIQEDSFTTNLHAALQRAARQQIEGLSAKNYIPGISQAIADVPFETVIDTIEAHFRQRFRQLEIDGDVAQFLTAWKTQNSPYSDQDTDQAALEDIPVTIEERLKQLSPSKTEAETLVSSMGKRAHPLLIYSAGSLQHMPPRQIQVIGASEQADAESLRSLGLDELSDLSAVGTNNSTTVSILSTHHGIPIIALNQFDEYRRNYERLRDNPKNLFHLDKERENTPYDPGSLYFVNPEEITMAFARALAYGWIVREAEEQFGYQPDFYHRLEAKLDALKARLSNERDETEKLLNGGVEPNSFEWRRYKADIKTLDDTVAELQKIKDSTRRQERLPSGAIPIIYLQQRARRGEQLRIDGIRALSLDRALEAMETGLLGYVFQQTINDDLDKVAQWSPTDRQRQEQKWQAAIAGFLKERNALHGDTNSGASNGAKNAEMIWSSPGQRAFLVEQRVTALLAVFYRITRLRRYNERLPSGYLLNKKEAETIFGKSSNRTKTE